MVEKNKNFTIILKTSSIEKGKINHFCLSKIRDFDLGERVETDEEFDAYRIAVRRKFEFLGQFG
ncbi:MAG: hypothetical protein H6620_12440 [Halobacteriovoraceae bacterium]|nr:hypothetical protein [Halobacteriovoraceae bacterium]